MTACAACGHPNAPSARFCNECGKPLSAGPPAASEGTAPTVDIGLPASRASGVPAEAPLPGELLQEGAILAGRFRVGRELGRGAFGIVMEAEDIVERQPVAVKLLNLFLMASPAEARSLRERFAREWAATSRLDHPRVARALRVGEERGVPFIVMERVPGRTLAELLAAETISREHGARILADVLEALDHAHRLGIVHRDVKPSNVMVEPGGRARLMDFGIAKVMETLSGAATTQTGLLGTPSYMSPEQAAGRPLDARSDLFSVGLVAYELLSGRRAFDGHPGAVIGQILSRPVPDLPTLPSALGAWLRKACAREPGDRFASAAEMARSLEGAGMPGMAPQDRPPAPTPVAPPPPPASSSPRAPSRAGRPAGPRFRYLVGLASTAFLVMLMLPRSQAPPPGAATVTSAAAAGDPAPPRAAASAPRADAGSALEAAPAAALPAQSPAASSPIASAAAEDAAPPTDRRRGVVPPEQEAKATAAVAMKKAEGFAAGSIGVESSGADASSLADAKQLPAPSPASMLASLPSAGLTLEGVNLEGPVRIARVRDAQGALHELRVGDRLADAMVAAIDAEGISLEMDGEGGPERRIELAKDAAVDGAK